MSDNESADREACMQPEALVKRAIESVRRHKPTGPGRRQKPYPLWVRVKGIFCHGSGYSDSICRRYGFDHFPDHERTMPTPKLDPETRPNVPPRMM